MLHAEKKWKIIKLFLQLHTTGAYAGEVHWVHVQPLPPPPPTWKKCFAQKCLKEEKKFRPDMSDMSAKKNVHVPLRYDKLKRKGKERDQIKEIKKEGK